MTNKTAYNHFRRIYESDHVRMVLWREAFEQEPTPLGSIFPKLKAGEMFKTRNPAGQRFIVVGTPVGNVWLSTVRGADDVIWFSCDSNILNNGRLLQLMRPTHTGIMADGYDVMRVIGNGAAAPNMGQQLEGFLKAFQEYKQVHIPVEASDIA